MQDQEFLFVEHGHIEATDAPHCGGCVGEATEATDKPHCDGCDVV